MDLALIQLMALPVLALLLWRLSINGVRVPRALILLGCFLGLAAFWQSVSYKSLETGSFLLARFEDDPYDIQGALFRDRISGGRITGELERRHLDIFRGNTSSGAAVQAVFSGDENVRMLIKASNHWLRLIFPDSDAQQLERSDGLLMIRSVAETGLSQEPENETVRFIQAVMAAQSLPEDDALSIEEVSRREGVLLEGLSVDAFWTSLEHRAFALWRLGNLRMSAALQNHDYQKAELGCALDAWWKAVGYLRKRTSSELLAASYNNMAVAYYTQFFFENRPGLRVRALRSLRRAEDAVRGLSAGRYHAAEIIRRNIEYLESTGQSGQDSEDDSFNQQEEKEDA